MAVGTFTQPNFQSQLGNSYKANIDNAISVFARTAGAFAVHERTPTSMGVTIDAGVVWDGNVSFSNIGVQNITSIPAPTTNTRRDLIVVNRTTGVATRVQGTQSASPVDPAIPANSFPLARLNLTVGMVAISNQNIDDIRHPAILLPSAFYGITLTNPVIHNAQINSTVQNQPVTVNGDININSTGANPGDESTLVLRGQKQTSSTGAIYFLGRDSAGNDTDYGAIHAVIADHQNGSEDSYYDTYAWGNGTNKILKQEGFNSTGFPWATYYTCDFNITNMHLNTSAPHFSLWNDKNIAAAPEFYGKIRWLGKHQGANPKEVGNNLGGGALQRSTLRRKINRYEHEEAADEFLKWVWAGGRKLSGLARRRNAERLLFLT